MTDHPIACTLNAVQRPQRSAEVRKVLQQACERRSLATGYALRFEASDAVLEDLTRLINQERGCCAFLRFRITIEPGSGPVWLELTGPAGTRAFLDAELW